MTGTDAGGLRPLSPETVLDLTSGECQAVADAWHGYSQTDDYHAARRAAAEALANGGLEDLGADERFVRFEDTRLGLFARSSDSVQVYAVTCAAAWADLAVRVHAGISAEHFEILTRSWRVLDEGTGPAVTDSVNKSRVNGVYIISVRREHLAERLRLRAATYAHVGMSVDAVPGSNEQMTLPDTFTEIGFDAGDLVTYIEMLHLLGTTPERVPGGPKKSFGDEGGVDSEGRVIDQFMLTMGGRSGVENWAECAEVAHDVWPRLLATLGAEVGGVVFDGDDEHRSLSLGRGMVPKVLRLKSGWDYDAEGNQVWLPMEEAWRRFVDHNEERGRRDSGEESYMDAKTMRRMRKHMMGFYAGKPTTRKDGDAPVE